MSMHVDKALRADRFKKDRENQPRNATLISLALTLLKEPVE